MSEELPNEPADVIRWTFTPDPARQADAATYLADLGWDVHVRPEGQVVATCDEPSDDLDETVEGLWALLGSPIEVTHEEFRRLELMVYQPEEGDEAEQAAA